MKNIRQIIPLLTIGLFAGLQAESQKRWSASLLFEEDFFWELIKPTKNLDKDYTGGGALAFTGDFVHNWYLDRPNSWLDNAARLGKWRRSDFAAKYQYGLNIGLTTFSPEGRYLNIATPLRDQRPYASLFFVQTSITSTDFFEKKALTTELSLGAWGLSWGGDLQTAIHRWYRKKNNLCDNCVPYDPKGWPNQISNGGEPTLLYSATYKRLLGGMTPRGTYLHKWYDAFVAGNASVGYHNALSGSVTGRLGLIRSSWWTFNSFPMGQSTFGKQDVKKGRFWRNTEAYVYGTLRPSMVLYTASLQGQFKDNPHELSSSQIKHFVGQAEVGFNLSFLKVVTLNAAFTYRTRQHKPEKSKDHSWFGVYATVRSPFNR